MHLEWGRIDPSRGSFLWGARRHLAGGSGVRSIFLLLIGLIFSVTLVLKSPVESLELNIESPQELEIASRNLVANIITRYKQDNSTGFATVGGFLEQKKVSWFGSAIIWFSVYQYSLQTGDTKFDNVARTALSLASYSRTGDILGGSLRSLSEKLEGKWNDDIGWWMRTFLKAVSKYGKGREVSKGVTYYDVAKKTFKEIFEQYDNQCGGGIYWSRNRDVGNKGYAYKSTITNTIAIESGAMLYKLSNGEDYYLVNAKNVEGWLRSSGILDNDLNVYDGLDVRACDLINKNRWSYNAGTLISAFAEMKNIGLNPEFYGPQLDKLISNSLTYFSSDGVPFEAISKDVNPLKINQDISTYISVFALSLADGFHATRSQELRQRITEYINNGLVRLVKSCSERWTCSAFISSPPIPDEMNPYNQLTTLSFLLAKHSILNVAGAPEIRDVHADDPRRSSKGTRDATGLFSAGFILLTILMALEVTL